MSEGARTGVLGGTFDPVHLGHLAAATAAADTLGLDSVLFIPSHQPPHRGTTRISAFHRFALVSLAVASDERFLASDLELERAGPSFTSDTLRVLQATGHAASQLFFILGGDAFAEIATWHEYPGVLDLASFVVVARPGHPIALAAGQAADLASRVLPVPAGSRQLRFPGEPGRILLLDAATPDISSTSIRERIARRLPLANLVPPAVEAHIRRHGLYLPDPSEAGQHIA